MRGSRRLSSGAGGGTSKLLAASSVTVILLPSADLARTPGLLSSLCSRTAGSRSTCPARAPPRAARPTRPSPVAGGRTRAPRGTAWDPARGALCISGRLRGVEAGEAGGVTSSRELPGARLSALCRPASDRGRGGQAAHRAAALGRAGARRPAAAGVARPRRLRTAAAGGGAIARGSHGPPGGPSRSAPVDRPSPASRRRAPQMDHCGP
jgi:hypothetical protein